MGKLITVVSEFRKRDLKSFFRYLFLKLNGIAKQKIGSYKSWFQKQVIQENVTTLGSNLFIGEGRCSINKGEGAEIHIGSDVRIYTPILITASTYIFNHSVVSIGDRTRIGPNTFIAASKRIQIGNDCLISQFVRINDFNGHPLNPGKYEDNTLRNRSKTPEEEVSEIIIGDNVWIGDNAFIQRGVKIGNGSIVGANSVVTKNVPENTIVFGNPARVILWLNQNSQKKSDKK